MNSFNKMFYKYLLSYLCTFVIPVVLIFNFLYVVIFDNIKNENLLNAEHNFGKIVEIVDRQFIAFENTVSSFAKNPLLLPSSLNKNDVYVNYLVSLELDKYIKMSTFVSDIGFQLRGSEKINFSNGSCHQDVFFDEYYKVSDEFKSVLEKDLLTSKNVKIYPAQSILVNQTNTKDYIICLYPVDKSSVYANAIFFIETKTIEDIANTYNTFGAFSMIMSHNGNEIFHLKNSDNDVDNASKNDIIIDKESGYNTMKYSFILSSSVVFKQINFYQNIMLWLFVLLAIIGTIVVYVMTKVNYRPIFNFKKNMENILAQDHLGEQLDFDLVTKTLKSTISNYNESIKTMNTYKQYVFEEVVKILISGDLNKDVESLVEELELDFIYNYYFVLIIDLIDNKYMSDIMNSLMPTDIEKCSVYLAKSYLYNNIIGIVNCDNYDDVVHKLKAYKADIEITFDTYVAVSIGEKYTDIDGLFHSYIEADVVSKLKFVGGNSFIKTFSEYSAENSVVAIPDNIVNKLTLSIKKGDVEDANIQLNNIYEVIRYSTSSVYLAKYYCYEIINTIYFLGLNVGYEQDAQYNIEKLFEEYKDLDALFNMIRDVVNKICYKIKSTKESGNVELLAKIENYIKENYKDYNLSVKTMASDLDMNSSYLSRYFKNQTGTAISDYIYNMRMEAVKKMLRETELTAKDVINLCGYNDVAYFTRRFKLTQGCTPTEYRKIIAENKGNEDDENG